MLHRTFKGLWSRRRGRFALLCATGAAAQAVDPVATRQLQALFDASWEASMQRYPEWATFVGDNRYGDKLFDASREGEAADYARARRELAEAKAIARDRLAPTDQVSLDIFIYELEQQLRMERFVGFRRLSLGSQGGFQTKLSAAAARQPGGDEARRRADPGAPCRVPATRRSGARRSCAKAWRSAGCRRARCSSAC